MRGDGSQANNGIKGQVISGTFGGVIARQKSGENFELGEIIVSDVLNDNSDKNSNSGKIFMQVYDLQYGSQISQQNLEMISGMDLEEDTEFEIMDKHLRNYNIALLKHLVTLKGDDIVMTKSLPAIFSKIRTITKEDITFLNHEKNPMFLGNLRSGSKSLDIPISLNGKEVLSHHILISGTTGKGKSNLMSNMLWDLTSKEYCSLLVLDPHDEYYGRHGLGLKDHPSKNVIYYSAKNVPPGCRSLKINIRLLKPHHFGCLDFSEPQEQAMNSYYRDFANKWIESIIIDRPLNNVKFNDATINVLKRRLMYLLDIDFADNQVFCNGIFDLNAGENTVSDIIQTLESGKTTIIDTSTFSGQVELLIGSLIVTEAFNKYKYYKMHSGLERKPVIGIVLEEAPRVLGKEVLEKGSNIFSTIAREGRKFQTGLIAITQLPSLIPREILANMNTKIILGTEMSNERQAIIDSAAQDLSSDSRAIASLDKGECIISSNFAKFAIPVKVPSFSEFAKKNTQNNDTKNVKKEFSGVGI